MLWIWSICIAVPILQNFFAASVKDSPGAHASELIAVFLMSLLLSIITWIWLGNRDLPTDEKSRKLDN